MPITRRTQAKTSKGKKMAKASSQVLIEANSERQEFVVCNPSAKEVWLALGGTAAAKEGIWLKKESGAYVNNTYTGAVSCITTEGEGEISFAEV